MDIYYKPSGKVSPTAYLLLALTLLVGIPILAVAYSYAIWYIPIIYINFIITAIFGVIIGVVINFMVIKHGKVRNPKLAIVFAVIGGILAWYFQWVVYADLLINTSDFIGNERMGVAISNIDVNQTIMLAGKPAAIFDLMGLLYKYGSWSMFGFTVDGIMLGFIWLAEFAIMVIVPAFFVVKTTKKPFDEMENKWFEEIMIGPFEYIYDKPKMRAELEASSKAAFDQLKPTKNDMKNHSIGLLFSSSQGQNYLSFVNKRANMSNGEIEWSEEEFVEAITISQELVNLLQQKADMENAPIS